MDKIYIRVLHSLVHPSGFERAAFPNGLPQALEASVAFQSQGEVSSSDDDHGGMQPLPDGLFFMRPLITTIH